VFCTAKHADLAEKVKQLALQVSPDHITVLASNTSVLAKYREHLISSYARLPHPSSIGWPQAGTVMYIDLTLVEAPPQQTDQQREPNQGQQKKVMLSELFDIEKSNHARKVVLIEGAAGSVKTTLTWHVCREWAAGRLFQQFDLLIYLSLDDPTLHSAKTLADFIPHESSDTREGVAKEIAERSGEGVCFLFDAWDEAPPSVQQKKAYVYQLISGISAKTLPHCSIVVTSRPIAAGSLHSVVTARVVINGFDDTQVKQFADTSLGQGSDARKELDNVFRKNPRVLGLCNLPINAAIVIYLLQLSTPFSKFPSTCTELFYALVINLLLRHMKLLTNHGEVEIEEFDDLPESILKALKSVCALAFDGVTKRKTQFVVKDLKALGIGNQAPLNTLGLLQAPRQLTSCGPQRSYSFLHYAVQEFLAAYHISKLSSEKQSEIIRQVLSSSPLSLVIPFYAGLTRLCNVDARGVLLEITQQRLDFLAAIEGMHAEPSFESSDRRRTALALMNCIYESQRPEISQQVALLPIPGDVETLEGKTVYSSQSLGLVMSFNSLKLEPTDCLSIGYFFANKQLDNVCHLDLSNCNIHDVEVKLLMTELQHGKQQQEGGLSTNLSLSQISHNGMLAISEALKSSASMLSGLILGLSWHPQITNIRQALKYLIEGLSRNTSCKELILGGCCLKTSHVYHLVIMVAFSNLKVLSLSGSNLTGAICLLAEAVKHNKTLIVLLLGHCNISDADLICLGKAIKTNTTLDGLMLHGNPFSSHALEEFVKTLANSKSVLQNLAVDLPKHWQLLYEDKQDKRYRFSLAPRIQYWGDYEKVSMKTF